MGGGFEPSENGFIASADQSCRLLFRSGTAVLFKIRTVLLQIEFLPLGISILKLIFLSIYNLPLYCKICYETIYCMHILDISYFYNSYVLSLGLEIRHYLKCLLQFHFSKQTDIFMTCCVVYIF